MDKIAGTGGMLLATTNQIASSHVPSAAQYPRRSARGRAGGHLPRGDLAAGLAEAPGPGPQAVALVMPRS
jgi:hypothetical protein